jgi:hypothetical protein
LTKTLKILPPIAPRRKFSLRRFALTPCQANAIITKEEARRGKLPCGLIIVSKEER